MNVGTLYHGLSVGSYSLSVLSFILAVFLFFRYRVIDIFNELSGRTLKKNMERLSALSGASSENKEQKKDVNTAEMGETADLDEEARPGLKRRMIVRSTHNGQQETEELGEDRLVFGSSARAGDFGRGNETDVLFSDADSTVELGEMDFDSDETVELTDKERTTLR